MKTSRISIVLLIIAAILLIPFIAMQFSEAVNWSTFDFIIMGILLLGTGLLIELTLRKISDPKNRLIVCGIVLGVFFLIWAELAIGVFGTPFTGS